MYKCKMKIKKIMYPKTKVESGDYAIFSTSLIKVLEGKRPVLSKTFGTVTLKGTVPKIEEGEEYIFTFDFPTTDSRGTSYKLLNITKEVNILDKKELLEFLTTISSKAIANELIKIDDIYGKLQKKDSEELLKVKGIGNKKLENIYKRFDELSDKSLAFTKLLPVGITETRIMQMCKELGDPNLVVDLCFNNPYKLIEKVRGIGFQVADEIAEKCNYANKEKRVEAAIIHILKTEGETGKSYLQANQLMQNICEISKVDIEFVTPIIAKLAKEEKIVINKEGNKIALKYYIDLEKDIAERILELKNSKPLVKCPRKWKKTIEKMEKKQGWKYDETQLKGIKSALENNIIAISGLAGTGKSTISNAICEIMKDKKIKMCCLSAKAAQRLREVTNREAFTIHKMLGIGIEEVEETRLVDADILIIDEASMINGNLFYKLLYSIKNGTKVLILGDIGQLTAIGNCSIFSDLIKSGCIPCIKLNKVHRQGQKSAINMKAIDIRYQKRIFDKEFIGTQTYGEKEDLTAFVYEKEEILEIIKNQFVNQLNILKDVREVQIITPMKNRGIVSTKVINETIQDLYVNKSEKFFLGKDEVKIYEGDKVINTKNDYKTKNDKNKTSPIFNGNIGIVLKINKDKIFIDFTGIGIVVIEKNNFKNIDLAYAITVHSSQGSQWKRVIVAVDILAYKLLNVELLYTAITRAIDNCDFIIEPTAMNTAIRTVENNKKQTFLPNFLKILSS